MKTLNSIACAGGIAVAMLSSATTVAGTVEQETATGNSNASSQVHRVSHALAGASSYQASTGAGYKWGKERIQSESKGQWSDTASVRSSYRWGNSDAPASSDSADYAGAASYDWNTMSVAAQSGYKWGSRSTSDQAGYKWGSRSTSDQAGYKWGSRSTSDQAGYKWGSR